MTTSDSGVPRGGPLVRLWRFLWRPSASIALAALLILGAVGGLLAWGAFSAFIEYAGTERFCISCHEMRDNPYADLQRTVHFVNRTGTRAICVDCHVPREFVPKMVAKTLAIRDLFFHAVGKLDTPEKFQAHRLELALTVWSKLKADDSRECRNCHQNVWIDTSAEFRRAAVTHKAALENGKLTCIDCHQGIAHRLPAEFVRPTDEALFADPDAWFASMKGAAEAD